ncbi:MAG: leucine-rich repeat protein [Catonella sp.]
MRLRKIQIIFLVAIAITFALTPVREAEAEDISTATQETESVQPATGGSITSGSAVDVTSPGSVTTGPAVTTPGSIEGEKEPLIEVLDEFDAGGISYMVTEIKDGKVYVEVTGVINDRATTVYIPKKTEYNETEMIVSSIGEDSFSYLERLRKVVVAADITHIAKDAFKGAEKFSRLVIKTSALNKVEKNIFKDVSSKLVVEVPKKKLTSYKKLFNNKGAKIKEIRAIKNRL